VRAHEVGTFGVVSTQRAAERRIADRYALRSRIGRGGMGTVWRADDLLLKREVAIKEIELPAALPPREQETTRSRVLREARAAARLNHQGAVTIFDVVEHNDKAFIVMELVDAPTLQELVSRDGPVGVKRAATIGLEVLGALEAAHARGIVHRDVKPANVMVPAETSAKLADFGIAISKDDTRITSTGLVLGSPAYMAPEQARGETSEPACDLWGLGVTLYYALEGRGPFERNGAIASMAAIVSDEPSRPEHAGSLAPVILSLLSKDPPRRPGGAELRDALGSAAGTGTASASTLPTRGDRATNAEPAGGQAGPAEIPRREPSPEPYRGTPSPRPARRPGLWAIPIALALLAAAALVAYFAFTGPGEDGATNPPLSRSDGNSGTQGGDGEGGSGSNRRGGGAEAPVPSDWVPYTAGDTGFELAYPPDWEIVPQESTTIDFRDPATGSYLRLAWTDSPGPSPEGAWEDLSQSFGASHDNYDEIRIDPTTFKGFDAAEWEYTYSEAGADLHAVDLGFVTGDYGFALNFQTDEAGWSSSQDTFDAFKASFEAP